IGGNPLRQSRFGPPFVVNVIKYGSLRQLPARETLAQLLGQTRAALNKRRQRRLGDLINHYPGKRGEFAFERLTGEQSDLPEIVSWRQSDSLNLAAICLHRAD